MTRSQATPPTAPDQEGLLNDPDFLREALRRFLQQFLDEEIAQFLHAEPYERTEDRQGYRNGYKPRQLTTRVGRIELALPQDRAGRFQSELFERYQRSEKALVLALQQSYLQGVSTRKVKAITEKLCGAHFSKSLVSSVCQALDTDIAAWLNRPLTQPYPYLVVDARYEHVRENHQVVSKGVLLVQGVGQDGHRDLLTVAVAPTESETSWGELFSTLIDRGLTGVRLVTSDEHKGLVQAVERYFTDAAWQYCQTHFQRSVLSVVPREDRKEVAAQVRTVYNAADLSSARDQLQQVVEAYATTYPTVADKLERYADFLLACFAFPEAHRARLRTTNALERLNREIARRSDVVQIFPNAQACLRLVAAMAMEWAEDWTTGKRYLDMEILNG